jgi:hypothetical protein
MRDGIGRWLRKHAQVRSELRRGCPVEQVKWPSAQPIVRKVCAVFRTSPEMATGPTRVPENIGLHDRHSYACCDLRPMPHGRLVMSSRYFCMAMG